jgi:hypothetical protein
MRGAFLALAAGAALYGALDGRRSRGFNPIFETYNEAHSASRGYAPFGALRSKRAGFVHL